MTLEVSRRVWDHSLARGAERLVLLAIADQKVDAAGWCWPSIEQLQVMTKAARSTVLEAVKRLSEGPDAELEVELRMRPNGGKGRSRYRVLAGLEVRSPDIAPGPDEVRSPDIAEGSADVRSPDLGDVRSPDVGGPLTGRRIRKRPVTKNGNESSLRSDTPRARAGAPLMFFTVPEGVAVDRHGLPIDGDVPISFRFNLREIRRRQQAGEWPYGGPHNPPQQRRAR